MWKVLMERRAWLQVVGSGLAAAGLAPAGVWAANAELTPASVDVLRDVATAVLPGSLGEARVAALAGRFVAWVAGWEEGVAVEHGYGHPRLEKTGTSPAALYNEQLAALAEAARAKGGTLATLPLEVRRALLDAALTKAGVTGLPTRPSGQHVVSDLMAFYFRSSEANDQAYRASISRQVCRPIAVTTRRPTPLEG